MVAVTIIPFGSLTLKTVLGSASTTTQSSNSIKSFLDKNKSSYSTVTVLVCICKHNRFAVCDCDRILIMSRQAAIKRYDRPAVFLCSHSEIACVYHRFYGKCHTGVESCTSAGRTVVRYLRIFVKLSTDSVTYVILNYRKAI